MISTYLQKALTCAFVLHGGLQSVESKEVKAQRSPGNFIIHEEMDTGMSYFGASVSITSNVPVTVKRYFDDLYLEGDQPVMSNEVYVVVNSNCAATTYVPRVMFGSDSVEVNIEGAFGGVTIPFLEPTSYGATWDTTSFWCEARKNNPPPPPDDWSSSFKSSLLSSVASLFGYATATQTTDTKSETSRLAEERNLLSASDVCDVNVEVMLDGCAHGVDVTAPKIRILDAAIENTSAQDNPENECVYTQKADIVFKTPSVIRRKGSLRVSSLVDQNFGECFRAVPGRPFVDATGSPLQASPLIVPATAIGEVKACSEKAGGRTCLVESSPHTSNSTTRSKPSLDAAFEISQSQVLLGQEWTKKAIGEHASIASFSVFSIALMTNQAPADLVEDALKAALEEVRHAKTSFDIASKLTGKEVGPGPLPESKHVFAQDTTALAMAVAREGCVDETLSALEAAAEADFIDAVLENGAAGTKYEDVGKDLLVWIRDELRTIASEESGHAALAWRTVGWVCSVDPDACDLVQKEVLNEDELERAFKRRFMSSFDARSRALEAMAETWRQLYSHIDVSAQLTGVSRHDNVEGDSLVAFMAKEILRGIACV